MISPNIQKQLIDLEHHQVGWFLNDLSPLTLIPRRECIEETLSLFDASRGPLENSGILSRATHLYKSKAEDFESLCQALAHNPNFNNVEILHQSSDLGLPYKIFALHSSGKEIIYDGVFYHLKSNIHAEEFDLNELEELAGYRGWDPVVTNFENSLGEVTSLPHIYSHTNYNFYTASPTTWKNIGIHSEGDPHLRLRCKDMKNITITALVYSEIGKNYFVYLGDPKTTLQMYAHEVFNAMELRFYSQYAEKKREALHFVRKSTADEAAGAITPFYRLIRKHQNWNSIKNSWKTLSEIRKSLASFDLLVQAYDKVIENRWAYVNLPRQIWLEGEERDDQEQIAAPCLNFFDANLESGEVTNISVKPSEPIYANRLSELKNLIRIIRDELVPSIDDETTLLTVFQTEFSLYAVWLAVLALLISLVSIIITLIASSTSNVVR